MLIGYVFFFLIFLLIVSFIESIQYALTVGRVTRRASGLQKSQNQWSQSCSVGDLLGTWPTWECSSEKNRLVKQKLKAPQY